MNTAPRPIQAPAQREPSRIVRNEALQRSLQRLGVDAAIGPELYRVAAVLLTHVFTLDEQFGKEQFRATD